MTAPTHRTRPSENLYFPEFIPIGDSPPPTPSSKEYSENDPNYLEPEDIRKGLENWQQQLYDDYMRKKSMEAKQKMLSRVRNNG